MPFRWRILLLLACVLWAVSFIAIKIALRSTPALTIASLRLVVAALCFAAWFAAGRIRVKPGGARGWGELFVLSVVGMGHYAIQTIGLQYTTAANASLYVVTGPISIILLAALFLRERITFRKALGIAIAVSGVLIVMGLDTLLAFEFQAHLFGDSLVLISIFMWGVFTVFGKRMTDRLGAVAMSGITTCMGAIWMLPVGWIGLDRDGTTLGAIEPAGWVAIAFMGVGCSFLATLFYFLALQHSQSQKVGAYLYTIPPMTALFATVYLGEPIGANLVAGSILVFAGVYLTERS
jgi:drug/metabolite transporter (DMT)-like permease